MEVSYADETITKEELAKYPHSIFLAGPTPRSPHVKSWRPDALTILDNWEYEGLVFVPERKDWSNLNYIDQVEWEKFGLNNCSKIVFWIPRKIPDMPAFTTNVEFGRYVGSGKIVYGRPNNAEKCDYLDWMYSDVAGESPHSDLRGTLKEAIGN